MFQPRYHDQDTSAAAQQMIRVLYDAGLSDQSIADMVCCTVGTINRLRHGRESGRNLERRIARVYETLRANRLEAGFG